MALEIKEEVSAVIFYKNVDALDAKENAAVAIADYQSIPSAVSPKSINVDIEGIHSIITRNYTLYTAECLKNSAPLWTSPYERPVIMHHKDKDGIQIGRVKNADFLESTRANAPGLLFTVNIGDETGIKGVQNGTLSTVSIGAVIHKATCSICGQNIAAEGECEHQRGRKYDGELCYWIMEDMEPKELSYVIVPSDRYANTIKIYKPNKNNVKESSEGDSDNTMGLFDDVDLTMSEAEKKVEDKQEDKAKEINVPEEQDKQEEEKDVQIEDKKVEDKQEEKKEEEKQEQEDKQEAKKEDNKEEMSKEALIDKCKELENLVKELQDDIKYLKAKLDKERGVRESLEAQITKFQQANKLHLAEQLNSLRKELSLKEEAMEDLLMRSEESLKESIKTFTEVKESSVFNVNKLPKIQSQALVDEDQDNISKEAKESENNKNMSNIDYEKEIDDWFMNVTQRKYFN